jgi:hypothetical protein
MDTRVQQTFSRIQIRYIKLRSDQNEVIRKSEVNRSDQNREKSELSEFLAAIYCELL